MTGSTAVRPATDQRSPCVAGGLSQLLAEREQLTHVLRGLASRLDELDRVLADFAWRHHRPASGLNVTEMLCAKTDLENERVRLTAHLGVMARQLHDLDSGLADGTEGRQRPTPKVGTCPQCGYPSLGSGLCAFCRPRPVR